MKSVGEPIEGQRPRERNHMAAINQPAAEAALALGELLEVKASGVLIEPGRDLVFGLLDRHAVAMIDLLAGLIVGIAPCASGERIIVSLGLQLRHGAAECCR